MTNLKWKPSLSDNGQQAIPVILVSKDENGDYAEGVSIGGGAVIDDENISETTVFSSIRTIQLINDRLQNVVVSHAFFLPEVGDSGQRVYLIDEETEYVFRGTFGDIHNLLGSSVTVDNGNTIVTNTGVTIIASSYMDGTSVGNILTNDETFWMPDPNDTNPYIIADFNGSSVHPYVVAYKLNNGVGDKIKDIRKYNLPNLEFNDNMIVKTKKETRILDEEVYHAKSNARDSYLYHKFNFNTPDIKISKLELVAGLWVPVY